MHLLRNPDYREDLKLEELSEAAMRFLLLIVLGNKWQTSEANFVRDGRLVGMFYILEAQDRYPLQSLRLSL